MSARQCPERGSVSAHPFAIKVFDVAKGAIVFDLLLRAKACGRLRLTTEEFGDFQGVGIPSHGPVVLAVQAPGLNRFSLRVDGEAGAGSVRVTLLVCGSFVRAGVLFLPPADLETLRALVEREPDDVFAGERS